MKVRHIRNATVAAAYTATFILIYRFYLNPVFEYAGYYWIERGFLPVLTAATMSVIPALLYRGLKSISAFIAVLIYVICYVPAVITLPVALNRDIFEISAVQFALMVGMSLFFIADRIASGRSLKLAKTKLPMRVVHAMTLLFTAFVLSAYSGNMRLVDFQDVYELREAASELPVNVLVGYMVMWLTYCLYPLYLAIGIVHKRWSYFVLASIGCVVIYMATGAKASVLTPVILICMYLVIRMKGDLFANLALILSGISLCLLVLDTDDNLIAFWARSLLFNRILGTGGWVTYTYYEFFTENRFTYLTHLNIINYLTKGYPYGAQELGQVIARAYGSEGSNYNAHFWASDGIAAFGIAGIYIVNVLVFLFLILLNLLTASLEIRFLCLWLTGFILGMLNLPFFTALLSAGGLLIVLLLIFVRIRDAERSSISYPCAPGVRAEPARA